MYRRRFHILSQLHYYISQVSLSKLHSKDPGIMEWISPPHSHNAIISLPQTYWLSCLLIVSVCLCWYNSLVVLTRFWFLVYLILFNKVSLARYVKCLIWARVRKRVAGLTQGGWHTITPSLFNSTKCKITSCGNFIGLFFCSIIGPSVA